MGKRLLIGLGVVVVATTVAACSYEKVAVPKRSATVASFARGGGGQCDPKYEDCNPCDSKFVDCNGRMTGGGGQNIDLANDGSIYVTRGFTIHCDIVLSNNLEINWPGHKWHIDKPLDSAHCIDDPAFNPEPPPAPFDTFIGVGTGSYDGEDGAVATFTFIDAGDGKAGKNDLAGIRIVDVHGNVVLDFALQILDNGNIQAHYDQPHGQHP